jgi:glutamyl-tRNA reductase
MKILMAGLDHERASLPQREALSLRREEVLAILPVLVRETGFTEGALLCTCNRIEFYGVAGEEGPRPDPVPWLVRRRGIDGEPPPWIRREDREAVEHLFGVAAGLCSMVKGEAQILGQVKDAFRIAAEAMTAGPVLNRLFHASFRAGKRVRAETGIAEGAVSVSQAAVELAAGEAGAAFRDSTILVIGAGVMARLVVQHLVSRGARDVVVVNRTPSRARELADEFRVGACGLGDLRDRISRAGIVISAASADGYLLGPKHLAERPAGSPLILVDIGFPRTVDPEVANRPALVLRDIDALNGRVQGNRQRREERALQGWLIVREETDQAMAWIAARRNATLIQSLAEYMETIRGRELRRVCGDPSLSESEKLEHLSSHLIRKITEPIIRTINDAAAGGDQKTLADCLKLLKDVYRLG